MITFDSAKAIPVPDEKTALVLAQVHEHQGIRPGDTVEVVSDSGFDEGRVTQHVVERIVITRWNPHRAAKTSNPQIEVTWCFVGGANASTYDQVTKSRPVPAEVGR